MKFDDLINIQHFTIENFKEESTYASNEMRQV